jgi:hypothetical protein
VLRVVLISIATALAATAVAVAVGVIRMAVDDGMRARASVAAVGKISGDFVPSDSTAWVVWTDEFGKSHLNQFVLDEPQNWHRGQSFTLKYDKSSVLNLASPQDKASVISTQPGARGVDELTGYDFWFPTVLIGGLALLIILAWLVRGRLNRAAAARAPTDMSVAAVDSTHPTWSSMASVYLLLAPPETPLDTDELGKLPALPRSIPGVLWQRVHWHPAAELIEPGRTIPVRIKPGFSRRAVVEPEPGARLWPAGRLTGKAPLGRVHRFLPRLKNPFYDVKIHPPLVIWLPAVVVGLLSVVRLGLIGAPLFIVGTLALTVFIWAWTAPTPNG